jgi:lipoic acid synthetase
LAAAGCDILTVGQYLAPRKSGRHFPVDRFVPPGEFAEYRAHALARGFRSAQCAPLVRSSYLAEENYLSCLANDAAGRPV